MIIATQGEKIKIKYQAGDVVKINKEIKCYPLEIKAKIYEYAMLVRQNKDHKSMLFNLLRDSNNFRSFNQDTIGLIVGRNIEFVGRHLYQYPVLIDNIVFAIAVQDLKPCE
jgi:hypothetical protein